MLTRRAFLRRSARLFAVGALLPVYGALVEPFFGLRVARYALTPPGWPAGLRLRLVALTDLHACDPWMSAARVGKIVETANALEADCALLLGDFVATHAFQSPIPARDWSSALARLRAPLGVHAVMGNHDWWIDFEAMRRGADLPEAGRALQDAGVRVYQNEAVRLALDGQAFWLAGLGDQMAFAPVFEQNHHALYGMDDMAGLVAQLGDDAPAILMAHEPDIFPDVPRRFALTLSGHTHGGQFNFFGWRPALAALSPARHAHGHFFEDGRHLIVSAGLGCSVLPLRIGAPPEIALIDIGAPAA